jgi:hypothetical protein
MEEQAIQALETFKHAAEEMRFRLNHQWLITNYAVIAYAALVAAPALVACGRSRTVNVVAVVLVLLVAWQAWRTLSYFSEVREVERARLEEAITHLPLIHTIRCEKHLSKERQEGPPRVGKLKQLWANLLQADELWRFPWGLVVVVGVGALFASLIIPLRIPPRLSPLPWLWLSRIERRWPVLVRVRERWAVLMGEFVVVVILFLIFLSMFILPDAERVVACPSQPASGLILAPPQS